MEIRQLTLEEARLGLPVWAQAFFEGRVEIPGWESWFDANFGDGFVCGVFDSEGLQAAMLVCDYRIYFGDSAILPMGGVGGVASLPASRGKGYANAGMKFLLAQMRERGYPVSVLFPFSWDFYRRLGWEWAGVQRKYVVPASILRASPETDQVRAATPADYPAIKALYESYARRYRGCIARTEPAWSFLEHGAEKRAYTYLYERDGALEGYFTHQGYAKEETHLREFIAITQNAQRGLLGLLRRHDMQVKKFSWNAPDDDTLWQTGYHWDWETHLSPCAQVRVVDVPLALSAYKPAKEAQGSLNLAVQDDTAPWNSGVWHIAFETGEVTVQPTQAEPQISLDIQALSQLYFGSPNAPSLRRAGRLQAHDESGYAALCKLFAGATMWMNDNF